MPWHTAALSGLVGGAVVSIIGRQLRYVFEAFLADAVTVENTPALYMPAAADSAGIVKNVSFSTASARLFIFSFFVFHFNSPVIAC